jgi:hypothetical protein
MGRPPKKYHFTTVHHYDDFEIKESDWADIESQSGYKLEQLSRSAILASIRYFLPMAEGERNAPLLYDPDPRSGNPSKRSGAEERLRRIRQRANSLLEALNEIEDYTSDTPELEADELIGMNCDRPELGGRSVPPRSRFCTRRLANILTDFVPACDAAMKELKIFERAELFKDGNAWNEWVVALAQIIAKQGLQVSASMYYGTSKKSNLPNFVRLIRALHKIIPPELVSRHSTDEALAKAAQRALRRKP